MHTPEQNSYSRHFPPSIACWSISLSPEEWWVLWPDGPPDAKPFSRLLPHLEIRWMISDPHPHRLLFGNISYFDMKSQAIAKRRSAAIGYFDNGDFNLITLPPWLDNTCLLQTGVCHGVNSRLQSRTDNWFGILWYSSFLQNIFIHETKQDNAGLTHF